ncbi:MAG TPA: hypothetical protein VMU06_01535 [Stellaceae bacterium]|nr:hypothetical protein [Stellaceae bacterium]
MALRVSRLALIELSLSVAVIALGAPIAVSAFHKSAFDERLGPATERRVTPEGAARLLREAAWSDSERIDLAFALLSAADGASIPESDRAALISRAAEEFRAYVSRVPGDGAAWAGLASAELARGDGRRAAAALEASILATPWSPSLVTWRCGLGIDLFHRLDEEGRELMKGQFRLEAQRSVSSLVRIVTARGAARIARILLASSPDELLRFEAELAKSR